MLPVPLLGLALAVSAWGSTPDVLLLTPAEPPDALVADVARDLADVYGARVHFAEQQSASATRPDVVVVVPSISLPAAADWGPTLREWMATGTGLVVAGLPYDYGDCARLWDLAGAFVPAEVVGGRCFGPWKARWIWTPPGEDETPDHHRYVRRTFDLPEAPSRAWVRMTADNLYTAHLNGSRFAYHWSWYDAELWEITDLVRPGRNVLAIDARNVDGPGGLLCEIGIEHASGKTETIVSDAAWKMAKTPSPGWTAPSFDDTSWPPPQTVQPYPAGWGPIRDQPRPVNGVVRLRRHAAAAGTARRFAKTHELTLLVPRAGAVVVGEVSGHPVLVVSGDGCPRAAVATGQPGRGSVLSGDGARDLLVQTVLWAAGARLPVRFLRFAPPDAEFTVGSVAPLPTWSAAIANSGGCDLTLRAETHDAEQGRLRCREVIDLPRHGVVGPRALPLAPSGDREGRYALTVTVIGPDGAPMVTRHATFEIVNPVNARLSVPANRYVTAEGYPMTFRAEIARPTGVTDRGLRLHGRVIDPWGECVHEFAPTEIASDGEPVEWTFTPPNLECGQYALRSIISDNEGRTIDTSRLSFHIVPPLDFAGFFPTTMRLSPFQLEDRDAIEREVEDIIAHGFNTLTFSAHRLGAEPGSPYDYAEDYAQQRGMAISYSFQGDFSILGRGAPPPVSVHSPEYAEAIRPRIERAVATAKRVPRLLNVQGYMDEPFQEGERTFDYSEATAAEYQRRFGLPLPRTIEVRDDPEAFLRYLDFRADYFPAGWRQSYDLVKETWEREMPDRPRFWVELTHDSHNTFGAAAGPSGVQYAVDDVFHWGAPFDSVNYDIYPYLSRDYRTGEFAEFPEPRMAGLHMAFAQMRNLAGTYNKKLGFWLESGWRDKLKPETGLADHTWSPRELTYTAIGQGCDYLNTFWGIPEDARWWDEYGRVMNEVKRCAPLIARSRRRVARACFIFPRTQHLLLQEPYWNVMVAYEAFLQAYGELDCVHEEQIASGKLSEYDVIALFDIHCLPRQVAEAVRGWVAAGGLLIADEVPQTDERLQPLGTLDEVFGVRGGPVQSPTPLALSDEAHPPVPATRVYAASGAIPFAGAPTFADGRPAFVTHRFGAGAALLMQFPLKDAYLDYLTHADAAGPEFAALPAIETIAQEMGLEAGVHSSNRHIEACVRETPEGTLLVFLVNHEGASPETTVGVGNAPPQPFVRDLVTGEAVPGVNARDGRLVLRAEVPFGETRLLGVFPYRTTGLALRLERDKAAPGERLAATATVNGAGDPRSGNSLLYITVRGPDGRVREAFSGRRSTLGRSLRLDLRLPDNAQSGRWRISVSRPWTHEEAHASFRVRSSSAVSRP